MARATTETWFFFGDSLTLGVNDTDMPGGWVSRLAVLGHKAGLYAYPPATFYNLGARRQSTADVARRWQAEIANRHMPGLKPHVAFCCGVVDMAGPHGGDDDAVEKSLAALRSMLSEARQHGPVLVISPPPVSDTAVCARIAALARAQAALCEELDVPFAHIHSALAASTVYMRDLSDGLHAGPAGCAFMAELLLQQDVVRDFLYCVEEN